MQINCDLNWIMNDARFLTLQGHLTVTLIFRKHNIENLKLLIHIDSKRFIFFSFISFLIYKPNSKMRNSLIRSHLGKELGHIPHVG